MSARLWYILSPPERLRTAKNWAKVLSHLDKSEKSETLLREAMGCLYVTLP